MIPHHRELWWAVYAYIQALQQGGTTEFIQQADAWQSWLDWIVPNMVKIFYRGDGAVCAVTAITDQTLPVDHPDQTYKCEDEGRINDPYEGELVAYFFHLLGDLSDDEKKAIWEVKRPQLVRDEYKMGGVGPITVERGRYQNQKYLCGYCRVLVNIFAQATGSAATNPGKSWKCPSTMLTLSGMFHYEPCLDNPVR